MSAKFREIRFLDFANPFVLAIPQLNFGFSAGSIMLSIIEGVRRIPFFGAKVARSVCDPTTNLFELVRLCLGLAVGEFMG